MTIRTKVIGLDRLQKKLRRIPELNRRGVRGAIANSALALQGDAARSIQQGARSGRIYTTEFFTDAQGRVRPIGKRPPHQASAPGEPPKSDEGGRGGLAGSIFAELSEDGLSAEVGTDVKYGTHLEFGTRKMAARPWLQPAFERNKDKIRARVEKAAKAANRKASR